MILFILFSLLSFDHKANNIVTDTHLPFDLRRDLRRRSELHQNVMTREVLAGDLRLNGIREFFGTPFVDRDFAVRLDERFETANASQTTSTSFVGDSLRTDAPNSSTVTSP